MILKPNNMSKLSHSNFRNIVFIILALMLNPYLLHSQGVGISDVNIVADPSSILELRSTSQGLLAPRLTTVERDAIVSPADGLLVFNTTTSNFNFYKLGWQVLVSEGATGYYSIDASSNISTTSTTDVTVAGMTLSPDSGTYVVDFNSQCSIPDANSTSGLNTADLKADLNLIYNDIIALTVTNTSHPLSFGSVAGETITPGVYSLAGAITLAGNLILDGPGVYVIRGSSTFGVTAGAIVTMINGASSENILWVAETGISVGASTTIPGTIFSNGGAIAVGDDCSISGRLLTKSGAMAFGSGPLSLPTLPTTVVDLQRLASFVMFTGLGAVANTGASTYTGDIGTDGGAITGFSAVGCVVNGTIYQAGSSTVVTRINHEATFSLYQNGILIPNSSRTRTNLSSPSDVFLHGIATVSAGQTIDVRWKVDTQNSDSGGSVSVGNRILSLTRVQ
jgi:hypothetical protein